MYVSEFVVGFVSCLIIETVFIIGAALISNANNTNKTKDKRNKEDKH